MPRGGARAWAGRRTRRGRARRAAGRRGTCTGRSRRARPTARSPSIVRCFSGRCQPRGRTSSVAISSLEPVLLALRAVVLDRPLDRVDEVDVPADLVVPGRRVRVLEVGHEPARARVQRVDHQLAVGRPGDLDPPVAVVLRRRERPASRPRGSRASPGGSRACRRAPAPPPAPAERRAARAPPRLEARVQLAHEVQRLGAQDLLELLARGSGRRRQSHGRVPRIEWSSRVIGWKIGSSRPSRCAAICSAQPGLPAATASAPVARRLRRLARAELAPRPRAGRGCRSRPSRSRSPSRRARAARAPGSRAAARAAGRARPARGRGGRRRGRRRAAAADGAAPAARARPAAR